MKKKVLPLVIVFALLVFIASQSLVSGSYTNVSVLEAKQMIDTNPDLAVLDVRTQEEYDSGHIENAVLIPVNELESRLDELDKEKEILVYCGSGVRSATASQTLDDNGFLNVYNMLGGITAWKDGGYLVYVKYSSIQAAINNANEGDTLFISSGVYYERVTVNKSLNLQGENKETTIIDGSGIGSTVFVSANNVNIAGFTIQGSDEHYAGVGLSHSIGNTYMSDNIIRYNHHGINIPYSSGNTIVSNVIINNVIGIGAYSTVNGNTICNNTIASNSYMALYFRLCQNNKIYGNSIVGNSRGISLDSSSSNFVYHNNFINNVDQVYVISDVANIWDMGSPLGGNYWSDLNPPDENINKISDIPYIIDDDNIDEYPLVYPFNYFPSPDVNDDGIVDIFDVVTVAKAFGCIPGEPNWNPMADINGSSVEDIDEIIDIFDIVLLANNFGKTT